MSEEVDISGLNFTALSALRERIDDRVREMRETGAPALLARFAEEAASLGLTVEEIVQAAGKRRGRPPKSREEAQA